MTLVGGPSWITFGVALGALGLAALAIVAIVERRRRTTIERTRDERARQVQLAQIASGLDLADVIERTLDAARTLVGADAAIVALEGEDRGFSVFATGITQADAERAVSEPVRDGKGTSVVELRADPERTIGTLWALRRAADEEPRRQQVALLEELARSAGPAIDNARRFQEARLLADFDALTGLHNQRYFHETLAREVGRAHRYGRRLALVVLDLDDFKLVNDRIGHLAGDAVLADAARRVESVVRRSDIACRVGGDEFAVILPESAQQDAENLFRRLEPVMADRGSGSNSLSLSAGIAELRAGEDATAFFKRADQALYRAKEGGKAQVVAAVRADR
jgi:diguanylate cyclase (GGDEF)-like protein